MRYERTDDERFIDNALLIALYAKSQEACGIDRPLGERIKLTKLAFLVAYPLFERKIKGLNAPFYRYKRGPFSKHLYENWKTLEDARLLVEEEEFSVTEEGFRFAAAFDAEVLSAPENRPIQERIEKVVRRFASMETDELLREVYAMECYTLQSPAEKRKIEDIPWREDFNAILDPSEDKIEGTLHISDSWRKTIELSMHPDALRNLHEGMDDSHHGRMLSWEEFFAHAD